MRTFVILLILSNLGYLGWTLYLPNEKEPVMVRAPARQTGDRLQLLEEIPEDQRRPIAGEAVPVNCLSLGVFNNTEESDFLVSALLERGLQARVELQQSGQVSSFRVYMPPFNSGAAARQTLEKLQDEGFDSFIITTGEYSGGISLGLFTDEQRALVLQENLAASGYATSIENISTATNEIWVTIEGLSQALLEGADLLDLLSEGLDLEVIEKPCEMLVSRP